MNKIAKSTIPNNALLYSALLRRDEAYDGFYFVCVKTTKIFCKLSCGARKPLESNVIFVSSINEAENRGFRPCKMCKPKEGPRAKHPLTQKLIGLLNENSEKRWSGEDLKSLGIDPSSARRAFIRDYGVSFLKFAREHRLGAVVADFKNGARIIDAQLDAGFNSASGFNEAINREIGISPSAIKNTEIMSAKWLETPIGPMLAIANNEGLVLLEFAERKALPREIIDLKRRFGAVCFKDHSLFPKLQSQLDEYFAGRLKSFSISISQIGSDFEKCAWQGLLSIPFGQTRSYSEQAALIDKPNAVRAIGRANGANKIAIIIPCHRVIGADGSMTGYGGKIWRKEWLLNHEAKYA